MPKSGSQLNAEIRHSKPLVNCEIEPLVLLLVVERGHRLVMAPGQILPTSGDFKPRCDPDHVHEALSVVASYRRRPGVSLAEPGVPVSDPVTEPPLAAAAHCSELSSSYNPVGKVNLASHNPGDRGNCCSPAFNHRHCLLCSFNESQSVAASLNPHGLYCISITLASPRCGPLHQCVANAHRECHRSRHQGRCVLSDLPAGALLRAGARGGRRPPHPARAGPTRARDRGEAARHPQRRTPCAERLRHAVCPGPLRRQRLAICLLPA